MKNNLLLASCVVLASALLVPARATASCQSICVVVWRACVASGASTPQECLDEKTQCLADCGGPSRTALWADPQAARPLPASPVCDHADAAPSASTAVTLTES